MIGGVFPGETTCGESVACGGPVPGLGRARTYDSGWQEKYQDFVATGEEAVKRIRPGQRIFIGTGVAEPLELVGALTKRASELPDTEILHLLTFGEAPYAHREMARYNQLVSRVLRCPRTTETPQLHGIDGPSVGVDAATG